MYHEYFGFQTEPFSLTPDSRFLFLSKRHEEALAALVYGVNHRKGFIAITGEVGSGKTTLCRTFMAYLDKAGTQIALILNPDLDDIELLQTICAEFGLPDQYTAKRTLINTLNQFLLQCAAAGQNCVLIIDEAQNLSPKTLEQVRMISNLETETEKLIQIVLVGQPELDDLLHRPELRQLNQRITVRYHLEPLDADEIGRYVSHRIRVAKPSTPIFFSEEATQLLCQETGGVPRRINVLCDRALLVAYVDDVRLIDRKHVEKAIHEVQGSRPRRAGAQAPAAPVQPAPPSPAAPASPPGPRMTEALARRTRSPTPTDFDWPEEKKPEPVPPAATPAAFSPDQGLEDFDEPPVSEPEPAPPSATPRQPVASSPEQELWPSVPIARARFPEAPTPLPLGSLGPGPGAASGPEAGLGAVPSKSQTAGAAGMAGDKAPHQPVDTPAPPTASAAASPATAGRRGGRRRLVSFLAAVLVLAGIGYVAVEVIEPRLRSTTRNGTVGKGVIEGDVAGPSAPRGEGQGPVAAQPGEPMGPGTSLASVGGPGVPALAPASDTPTPEPGSPVGASAPAASLSVTPVSSPTPAPSPPAASPPLTPSPVASTPSIAPRPSPTPSATPPPSPSVSPLVSPEPTSTPAPEISISPPPSSSPSARPSPSPGSSPTISATASPSPSPSPSASASPSPSPSESPSPSPSASLSATPSPSASSSASPPPPPSPSPSASPHPTRTPAPTQQAPAPEEYGRPGRWDVDTDGVVRVDLDGLTEVASVLTWLQQAGKPIDLSPLKSQSPEQIARLELAAGRPPLWLRRAPLPLDLPLLTRWRRSCIIRFGAPMEGAFSWAMMKSAGPDRVALLDPRHGAVALPPQALQSTLLGAYGLYLDPDDLGSLRAGDEGPRVDRLRERLRAAGAVPAPAGPDAPPVYDRALTQSVAAFRQQQGLPANGAMDSITAWLLLTAPPPNGVR